MTVTEALKSLLRNQADRVFLAEECAASGKDQGDFEPGTARQVSDTSEGKCGFAFRHLTSKPADEPGGLEVQMAGRPYLVDPTPADVENSLEVAKAEHKTLHILFLSFERLHKYRETYARLLNDIEHSVVLYCPWMYWEHLYAQNPETFRGWGITASDDYSEPEVGSAMTQKRCKVVAFDVWMDIQKGDEAPDRPPGYYDGVRLHMSFAVAAAAPALQAAFCCNGRELVVRPPKAWGVGDLFASRREGLVDPVNEYGKRVDTVKLANQIAAMLTASRPEAIRRQLQRRLVEVEYWSSGVLQCDAGEPLRLHRPLTVTSWTTARRVARGWNTVEAQSCDPVNAIATPTIEPLKPPEFQSFGDWEMLPHVAEVKEKNGATPKWIIGIACGRPAAQSTRRPELVGPLRRFAVQTIGSTELDTISLLEWQLDGVATLALVMGKKDFDVLLLTTPQVEDAVRQELLRLQKVGDQDANACMNPPPGVEETQNRDIVYKIRRKVPAYEARRGGNVRLTVRVARQQLLKKKENTLDLYYNGHFGIVRSLLQLNDALGQDGFTHALTLSHNNLGVFGEARSGRWTIERLLEWMNMFSESDCAAAVEVFQLDPGAERRWDELSICINTNADNRFRLAKRSWYPDDLRMEWPRTKPGARQGVHAPFFSSNTWYLNLRKLHDAGMYSLPFKTLQLAGGKAGNMSEKAFLTGEPVDLLSWPDAFEGHRIPKIGVFAVRFEEGEDRKNRFHRHQRFTVVLEDDQFDGLPEFRRRVGESSRRVLPPGRLYPLTPATKRNVWGGTQISQKKGWEKEQIGETWEFSTHPAGPAMYVDDDGVPRPLQQLTGPLDHMGKFLDCTSPLSIQVHPTSAGLRELQRRNCGPLIAEHDRSKEEAFYVIAVARARDGEHERAHLISGFNRDRLATIANQLLPALAQWHVSDPRTMRAVVDALASSITNELFVPLLRKFNCLTPAEDSKPLVEAFKAEEGELSLERAIEFYAGQIGTAAQSSAELAMYAAAAGVIRGLAVLGSPLPTLAGLEKHCKDHRDGIRMKDEEDEPLFGLFNAVQLRPGEWFRVPAGTPHAFQGGGNLVIEVSNRSDTTYRIADFGREYTPSRREMHYGEAMFSLGPHAFQDASTSEAYRLSSGKTHGVCHKNLESRVHRRLHESEERAVVVRSVDEFDGLTYLFNLGGPVRIDTPTESLTLTAYGAALATPKTPMWLHLGKEDQVLEVRPRDSAQQRHASGERGKEVLQAVWPLGKPDRATLVEGRGVVFDNAPTSTQCLIYPGHVRYIAKDGKPGFGPGSILGGHAKKEEEVKTEGFEAVLGDAQVAALGEGFHPLGGLRGSGGGMVINFGPGFCAGFFDDSIVLAKIDDGTGGATSDEGKANAKQDSLKRMVERLNMYSAIGAVGRWLYIDPLTSRLYLRAPSDLESNRGPSVGNSNAEKGWKAEPADEWTEFWSDPLPYLTKWIFGKERTPSTEHDGEQADQESSPEWPWMLHPIDKSVVGDDAIRLSGWLSAEAIALRCYLAVLHSKKANDVALNDFAGKVARRLARTAKAEEAARRTNKPRRHPDPRDPLYRYWMVYRKLRSQVPSQAVYKAILADPESAKSMYWRVIDDVARELAMVIKCLHKVLAHIPQTSKLAFSRTVLTTDPEAWAFGLTDSADAPSDALASALSDNLEGVCVTRSYINSTTARAAAGFGGYLHGRTPL